MLKKCSALLVLSVFLALAAGCQTITEAFKGAGEGAKKDWESAKKIDTWIKDNLW